MKWLVIIAILIIVAVGMLWLRTVRQGPETVSSRDPHRLDDSVVPPAETADPLPHAGPAIIDGGAGGAAAEPPSSSTWASEQAGTDEPGPHEDLPPSETRPQA